MRFLSILVSIVLLAGGVAACVPSFDQYYYISLAHHADVHVMQSAKPGEAEVYFADIAPSDYQIRRKDYVVRIRVTGGDYWPSVLVAATSAQSGALQVKPLAYGQCGSFEELGRSYEIEGTAARKYVWAPAFHKDCSVGDNQTYQRDQSIQFEVLQPGGEVLGSEKLDFELIQNGSYLVSDSI